MDEHHHAPCFRVWLCGAFRVERRVGASYEGVPTATWGGSSYPRLLLKALLCCPGRQIRREALIEMLWPESDPEQATQYLNTATTKLRRVLSLTRAQASLLQAGEDARHYLLEGQHLIWMDADEALALLKAAERRGRTSPEALPLLEQAAAYFNCGTFLDGEEGLWALGKRASIERARYRCQLWLVETYEQQGMAGQAEVVLETLLEEDPTDEDALCRLMDLLHRQGMTHKALRLYEQTCETLSREGLEPAEAMTTFYEHLKHTCRLLALSQSPQSSARQDEREPLSAALQEAESRPALVGEGMSVQQTEPLLLFPDRVSRSMWTSRNDHHALDLLSTMPDAFSDGQDLGVHFALGAIGLGTLLERGWSVDAVLEVLQMILPVIKAMPMITRRTFLQAGAATLLGGFPLLDNKQISEEESAQLCWALGESIQTSWKLFLSTENKVMLATGQALLILVQQVHALLYPAMRPFLYTGAYSLIGIALHFRERDQEALQAYQSSYIAALSSGDPWYVAQSLICQSDSFHTLGQYDLAIQKIEEALRVIGNPIDETQRRAKAHLLSCWADNAMMLADHMTAQEKLEAAAVYLDQLTANEEFDHAGWLLLAGKYALITGEYEGARQAFEQALTELPEQWTLRRAMTAIGLAMAYARLRERDGSLQVAESVAPVLQRLNTPKTNHWFTGYLQQDLLGHFKNDERVRAFVTDTYRRLPQLTSISQAGR